MGIDASANWIFWNFPTIVVYSMSRVKLLNGAASTIPDAFNIKL